MKRFSLLISSLLLATFSLAQVQTKIIELKNEPLHVQPRQYYIADVKDIREDKSGIGNVDVGLFNKQYRAELKDGAEASIKTFLDKNLPKDTSLIPMVMKIKELTIQESRSMRTGEVGECNLRLEFESHLKGMAPAPLLEISVSASQSTLKDITKSHEALIRQSLEKACRDLDRFIATNENHSALIRGVKIKVLDYPLKAGSADTILYNNSSRLSWADFKGVPDQLNKFSAVTCSGFMIKSEIDLRNHYYDITVQMKTFFVKNLSWGRPEARKSPYMLEHEQMHFNISRLCALEFRKDILSSTFPREGLVEIINEKYKKAVERVQDLQKQYDTETNHALNKKEQAAWEKRISEELTALEDLS